MKIGWGLVAGLGTAGLLFAGVPAQAQSGSSGSTTGSGSTGSSGSATDTSKDSSKGSSTYGGTGTSGSTSSGSTGGAMGGSSTDSTYGGTAGSTASGAGTHEVTGKVQKFDRKKNELSLSLKVSESTQVTKNGKTASLSDIKEGDQVRASFSGSGESAHVTQIEVMPKGSSGSMGGSPSDTGSSGSGSSGSMGGSSTGTGTGTGSSGSSPDTTGSGSSGSSSGSSTSGTSGSTGRGY